jgi:hypothetical protein
VNVLISCILLFGFMLMLFRNGSDIGTVRIKLSIPGLSLLTRGGFMVMALRQSNNSPNGKVQTQ